MSVCRFFKAKLAIFAVFSKQKRRFLPLFQGEIGYFCRFFKFATQISRVHKS